jgi:FkbM family methyltransferase
VSALRTLLQDKRALARLLLGSRGARELHARRWARAMPRYLDPSRRPFEMALIDRFVGAGDTVLDFGAHGGAWTYPLSERVGATGRVHAFEIFPYYAETLERALALRRVENVTLHAHGVGEADGEVSIVLVDENDTVLTGMVHTAAPDERPRKSERVPVRSFDSLAAEDPELLRARFAKIDIEGAELSLFRGARTLLEQARPVIFCEVTKRQCLRNGHTREDVLDYLRAADYGVNVFHRDGSIVAVEPGDTDLPGDFLFLPRSETPSPR